MRAEKAGDAEQRLFGLMAVAEEQQAAAREALDGFATERAALSQERAQLGEILEAVRTEAGWLRKTAAELGPKLALRVETAAKAAVKGELAEAGTTAATAVEAAAQPLLTQLSGVAEQAGAAEASLRHVAAWASWRLLGRGAVVVGLLAGLLWLADLSAWWWTERDLETLRSERTALQAEIAGLRANRDALAADRTRLVQEGVLARINRCNPGSRPCIRVDEAAGAFGTPADYRVILGY